MLSPFLFGQNQQRISVAIQNSSSYAKLVPNAQITVCTFNAQLQCTSPVTVYSDEALTVALPEPFFADINGNYSYYASPGQYIEQVCAPLSQCYTFPITLISSTNSSFTSINGVQGVFVFTGSGVSCVATTCTFNGGGSSTPGSPSGSVQTNQGGVFTGVVGAQNNAVVFNPVTGASDFGFPPAIAPSVTTSALSNNIVNYSWTSYKAYGDSNTEGDHAVGVLCNNVTHLGTCYVDYISQQLGVTSATTNYGAGGTALVEAQNKFINTWNEDTGSTALNTILIGSNDASHFFNQAPTTSTYEPVFIRMYQAMDEWGSVASSNKQAAGAGTLGAGWTTDNTYTTMLGATASTNGAILDLPSFTMPLGAESIVLWYQICSSCTGAFSYQLIRNSDSALITSGVGSSAPQNAVTLYSPINNFTYAITSIMFPGYSVSLPIGTTYHFHIVTTNAAKVTILGSGLGPSWYQTNYQTNTPRVWVSDVPLQLDNLIRGGVAALSADIRTAVSADQAAGFPVNYIENWNWVHGTFPEYGGVNNAIHLSVLGQHEMANAFLSPTAQIPIVLPSSQGTTIQNATVNPVVCLAGGTCSLDFTLLNYASVSTSVTLTCNNQTVNAGNTIILTLPSGCIAGKQITINNSNNPGGSDIPFVAPSGPANGFLLHPGYGAIFTTTGSNNWSVTVTTGPSLGEIGTITLVNGTFTLNTVHAFSQARYSYNYHSMSGTPGILSLGTINSGVSVVFNSLTTTGALNTSDNSTIDYRIY